MSVAIRKLIARLEKNIVAENDPAKRKSIASSLEAAKKTMKHIEHTESEETPDEEEEEEEEGGNETDREEAGEEEETADEPPAKSKSKSKAKAKEPPGGLTQE